MNYRTIFIFLLLLLPQLSNAASVSDFNPVAHWSFDEEDGIAYDSTPNGNDLTDNNTVGRVSGLIGNAADFEATQSEYFSITDNTSFTFGNNQLAISVWFDIETCASGYNPYFVKSGTAEFDFYGTNCLIDGIVEKDSGSPPYSNGGKSTVQSGITSGWHHICWFIDTDGDLRSYYDASDVTNYGNDNTNPIKDVNNNIRIGQRTGTQYYDGLLDEFSVFDSFSDGDTLCTTLYNSGTPLPYEETIASTTAPFLIPLHDNMPEIQSIVCETATCTINYATSTKTYANIDTMFILFLAVLISMVGMAVLTKKLL